MHSYSAVVQSIASGVGTAFIIYISVVMRKGVKKFRDEHNWLMKQVESNTENIKTTQEDIKRLLDIQERRERERTRAARRSTR